MTSCVPTRSVVQLPDGHCDFPAEARTMPPGLVCPAIVKKGFETCSSEKLVIRPATRKMHVRGPLASTHARSEPPPESFRLVTSITAPPRPPALGAPPPCAPGKAAMLAGFLEGSGVGSGVGIGFGGGVGVVVGGEFGAATVTIIASCPTQPDTPLAN